MKIKSEDCLKFVKNNSKNYKFILLYLLNKPKVNFDKKINIKILKLDLTKADNFKKLPFKNVESFYHFASDPNTFVSNDKFNSQFYINTIMTMNIVDYCNTSNVRNLFFASSVYVYSGSAKKKFKENDHLYPEEILGSSKLSSELILKAWSQSLKTKIIIMRFFTVYGKNANLSQFIPRTIKKIENAKKNISFLDNNISRDFIHIDDVTDIILRITHNLHKINDKFFIINIGNGKKIKILFIIKTLVSLINPKLKLNLIPQKNLAKGDHNHCADITKLKNLGYKQSVSIKDGLKLLINNP